MLRTLAVLTLFAAASHDIARSAPFPDGRYEVTTRLELPHLERYSDTRTETACLPQERAGLPVPVFRLARVFARCQASDLRMDDRGFGYGISCPGRASVRAVAEYRLSAGGFEGRVAIVSGGKNMTMTEVQTARRIGACRDGAGRSLELEKF